MSNDRNIRAEEIANDAADAIDARAALIAEREALVVRLAEIDTAIAEMDATVQQVAEDAAAIVSEQTTAV